MNSTFVLTTVTKGYNSVSYVGSHSHNLFVARLQPTEYFLNTEREYSMRYGIHWFRRDLRVAGNPALQKNRQINQGRVLGLFCFDRAFLNRDDFSINRFQFFLETLLKLRDDLLKLGGDLLVLDQGPQISFPKIFRKLQDNDNPLPQLVSWNCDYEPFALRRDSEIEELCSSFSIDTVQERDHLLIEPHELAKDNGEPYQIYTAFAKKWLLISQQDHVAQRIEHARDSLKKQEAITKGSADKIFNLTWQHFFHRSKGFEDHLESYIVQNSRSVSVPIPQAGSSAALGALKRFRSSIDRYKETRDFPAVNNTSGLSIFLKNGSLTIAQIIAELELKPYNKKETSKDYFYSELIWREFYYHILYRFPHVEENSFLGRYNSIAWENNESWFSAWKEGLTGFPIVDAGMRQLKQTGLMHNRVRMIVASFLTKDLLIDWRSGENYFMQSLLDGDIAPNNGGWQWSASTGCDPQPYFRIFNPWLQSKRFDPKGSYIKQFIPELKDLPANQLHQPIKHNNYPPPMVDHSAQKEKTLKMYKQVCIKV